MISIKKFVDINIQPQETSADDYIRDTVVLFTPDGDNDTPQTYSTYEQFEAYAAKKSSQDYTLTKAYLKIYFENGGVKVIVYEKTAYTDLTEAKLKALDNKLIYVVVAVPIASKTAAYTTLQSLMNKFNDSVYGIDEKILLIANTAFTDTTKTKNFAVKYSNVLGAEMTMAAYLSQIVISEPDSVKDYMFTQEFAYNESNKNVLAENITDDDYDDIITNNYNVDIELAGSVRNCGGNCKDGYDLVNNFLRIVLTQTATSALTQLLVQKIKLSTGIAKIYSVLAEELEKYKTCGYLTTDDYWKDKDLKVTRNGTTYTIIKKGDALLNGYLIDILPTSALSEAERQANSTPPIYLIIADQYGIRKITINGKII